MVRTYSQQTSVILPRLNAPYAYILLSQVQTAATAQQAQLEANSGGLPQFIARPLARLNAATLALGLALQLAPPPADTAATRAADTTFDNAWGGLHQFLSAALKLAPGLNPDPAGTQALMALLFPDGTAFLTAKYLAEWQASRARLDALADPANQAYLETLQKLGGQLQLASVQQAHAGLGAAIGVTTVLPAAISAQVGNALDEALEALRVYACKGVAWPDPEEPGSQELADALLEPLVSWEDYQSGKAGSSPAEVPAEVPSVAPAGTPEASSPPA